MEFLTFDEAVFGELVVDFAGRAEIGGQKSDVAKNDHDEEGPPALPDGNRAKGEADENETDIPPSVATGDDIFLGLPRDVLNCLCHELIITQFSPKWREIW